MLNGLTEENKEEYSLSLEQMQYLNPHAKIYVYDKINNFDTVEDMMDGHDAVIILYLLQSRTSGHWVCLFRSSTQGYEYEWFDSYGKEPDWELDLLSPQQRAEYKEKSNKLKQLLDGHKVIVNRTVFQGRTTDTCGMWVTNRLHNMGRSLLNYTLMMKMQAKKYGSGDAYVSSFVYDLLS